MHGSLAVLVDDGHSRCEIPLEDPTVGLYMPPMVWAIQYKFNPDTALLVFCSDPYDAADYIGNTSLSSKRCRPKPSRVLFTERTADRDASSPI